MSVSRPRKHRLRFVLCTALPFCFALSLAQAQDPAHQAAPAGGQWKALEVLPKDITKPKLKEIMKAQSKALGVDCDHCHKEPNMEADTPKKKIAREMMLMTAELNKKYRATTNGKVTCWSCHRGEKLPAENPK
mgnify:CR=1 FL=1